jgi:hypothetical protein
LTPYKYAKNFGAMIDKHDELVHLRVSLHPANWSGAFSTRFMHELRLARRRELCIQNKLLEQIQHDHAMEEKHNLSPSELEMNADRRERYKSSMAHKKEAAEGMCLMEACVAEMADKGAIAKAKLRREADQQKEDKKKKKKKKKKRRRSSSCSS